VIFGLLIYSCMLLSLAYLPGCKTNRGEEEDYLSSRDSVGIPAKDSGALQPAWIAPDTTTIAKEALADLIWYGRSLVANTAMYLGPKGKVKAISNGMNCQNCHLKAGTQLYGNSYSAVFSIYPKFRARSGTVEDLQKRINDCMERSLNGEKLASNSREMQALVAYINWVGKDVPKNESPKGASVVDLPYLERPADPSRGAYVFKLTCERCHGENGSGKMNPDSMTYQYPPLWGPHSYTTAAGMYRLTRLAGFIKSNMPNDKSTHEKPMLSDEEAWDVAAYISSMPRPVKKFAADWPDISKKPIDLPFGPYADSFPEVQHKYGPFKEIAEAYKK
jgi:thiosulfate dehydrogenase